MAGGEQNQVYATLLLTDSYLPGALVLAHSLRDAQSTKKLACLVTLDSVSAAAVTQLQAVYDYVLPVPRIRNASPANLYLMNRSDLHSAFTKINLWKLTQFSKIVYIDADVVAYRAPDELFSIPHAFAAAPDIGWPDLFNSGVMVLTPNMGDYYAMMAMAERGISFDGADQGLLNMHFKNSFHRLSFTYNVTPSAHYQYIPAYRHFQSSINMVHFIGSNKPWFAGRNAPHGSGPFDEMVGRWWAVYDRHYRVQEDAAVGQYFASSDASFVQYFTKGEFQPQGTSDRTSIPEHHSQGRQDSGSNGDHENQGNGNNPVPSATLSTSNERPGHSFHALTTQGGATAPLDVAHPALSSDPLRISSGTNAEAPQEQQVPGTCDMGATSADQKHEPQPPAAEMSSWDAQRQPPPADSKPEAFNFPSTQYTMSRDVTPFVAPTRYPDPPKNMWYEVPKEAPAHPTQVPKPVFPWEGNQPKPSRSFASSAPELIIQESSTRRLGEIEASGGSQAHADILTTDSTSVDNDFAPTASSTPIVKMTSPVASICWSSFQHTNAWDEIPEINRYVEGLQQHHRVKSKPFIDIIRSPTSRRSQKPSGFKLTDFPSEVDRPSLPVTPAPIGRSSFIGEEDIDKVKAEGIWALPAAEGVPNQSDWVCAHGRWWKPTDCLCALTNVECPQKDPDAQLQKLARQQYDVLLRKLGGCGDGEAAGSRIIPRRSMPFGSEYARSPTYVAQSPPVQSPTVRSSVRRGAQSPSPAGSRSSSLRGSRSPRSESESPRRTVTFAEPTAEKEEHLLESLMVRTTDEDHLSTR